MKRLFTKILRYLAVGLLRLHKPRVVAVAGSVGKTATRIAVATVLQNLLPRVRAANKNFNNEVGVPLAIVGAKDYPHEWWDGLRHIVSTLGQYFNPWWPKQLVLELAADHPGDLDPLLFLTRPTVGVLTAIAPEHLEFFGSLEAVAREEKKIVTRLPRHGLAVLNVDDPLISSLLDNLKCRVISYGFQETAQVRLTDYQLWSDEQGKVIGIQAKVSYQGHVVPLRVRGVVGRHQLLPPLAAMAVALMDGFNLVEITQALVNYRPPVGRMNLLSGIKDSLIIDDTYNSSPAAAEAALRALLDLPTKGRRIVMLGEMLELGNSSPAAHGQVGKLAFELGVDYLITVGEPTKRINDGAVKAGLDKDHSFNFSDPVTAARFLQDRLNPGEVILVKGSQGARMEKAVKELMAEPWRAKELIPRQTEDWLKR